MNNEMYNAIKKDIENKKKQTEKEPLQPFYQKIKNPNQIQYL